MKTTFFLTTILLCGIAATVKGESTSNRQIGSIDIDYTDYTIRYNIYADSSDSDLQEAHVTYVFNGEEASSISIPTSITYQGKEILVTALEGKDMYNSGIFVEEINGRYIATGHYTFTSITLPDHLTSIGNRAFNNCKFLASITIPNEVTYIGEKVFAACYSLASIEVASDNPSYRSVDGVLYTKDMTRLLYHPCGKKGSYVMPESVTSIANGAFDSCASLTSITISGNVTGIPEYTFRGCASLTSVAIPDNVTTIGSYAFNNCTSMTSIYIPDNVTTIDDYAFSSCTSMTSISIPSNVTTINYGVFSSCTSMTSIYIPDNVTTIGPYAFKNCRSMTSIYIPDNVTTIGPYAFENCRSLTSIYIPDNVTTIDSHTFYGCSSLTSIPIPDNVTDIEPHAFNGCTSLTSIYLPSKVRYIGFMAFYNCESLSAFEVASGNGKYASVDGVLFDKQKNELINYPLGKTESHYTIPEGTNGVGEEAFYQNPFLTSISIPVSVTKFGKSSLSSDFLTGDVFAYASIPPKQGSSYYVFSNATLTSATLHVPVGCKDIYQNTMGWGFANIVEDLPLPDPTGIEKVFTDDAVRYADGKLFLPEGIQATVCIHGQDGRLVRRMQASGSADLGSLPTGLYIVTVATNGQSLALKIAR